MGAASWALLAAGQAGAPGREGHSNPEKTWGPSPTAGLPSVLRSARTLRFLVWGSVWPPRSHTRPHKPLPCVQNSRCPFSEVQTFRKKGPGPQLPGSCVCPGLGGTRPSERRWREHSLSAVRNQQGWPPRPARMHMTAQAMTTDPVPRPPEGSPSECGQPARTAGAQDLCAFE